MTLSLPERLETPRLALRAPRPADAPLIFNAYTQDIDVARYMTWRPNLSVEATAAYIEHCIEVWHSGRGRPYVLTPIEDDGTPIGMLDARLQAHTVDLGYVLQRAYWRRGLMSEAVRALSDAALATPDYFRVQATCYTENHASARTLEKSGFKLEGRLERHLVLPNLSDEPRPSLMYARCR